MLVEKIKDDLTKFLKAGDKTKVSLTRLLLAAVKDKEISLRNNNSEDESLITDSVVMDIIKKINSRNTSTCKINSVYVGDVSLYVFVDVQ